MSDTKLIRIGIFYDGSYFAHVSDYYLYNHERRARISIQGLHSLIRDEVGQREQTDARYCQIVEAHYFRGRFSADDARRHDAQRQEGESLLYRERRFEDALIRACVTPHFLPLFTNDDGRPPREKGVDVWLALEAFDLACSKELNVIVLVTGDGDYVPLVRKLNGLGARVMVTAWDLPAANERSSTTRTAQALIDEVTYPVMMGAIIDDRARRFDPLVVNLFVPRSKPSVVAVETAGDDASGTDGNESSNEERGYLPGPAHQPMPLGVTDAEDAARELGHVANIPHGRDFGFIDADAGGERLFFYHAWVEGSLFSDLQVGDRVAFTPDSNPRDGRPVARRVVRQSALEFAFDGAEPEQPQQSS